MIFARRKSMLASLAVITTMVLMMSLAGLAYYGFQYREASKKNETIAGIAYGTGQVQAGGQAEPDQDNIRHEALQAINPDYTGWIEVMNTSIRYPIVQGTDNHFYLNHGFDRARSAGGSIFMDAGNQPDFSDNHTMVYGHHMKDGSMFRELRRYLEPDFFNKGYTIHIYIPGNEMIYEVFAAYEAANDPVLHRPGNFSQHELEEYLEIIGKRAPLFISPVESEGINILTLVTCGYSTDDARIIVHARKMD